MDTSDQDSVASAPYHREFVSRASRDAASDDAATTMSADANIDVDVDDVKVCASRVRATGERKQERALDRFATTLTEKLHKFPELQKIAKELGLK